MIPPNLPVNDGDLKFLSSKFDYVADLPKVQLAVFESYKTALDKLLKIIVNSKKDDVVVRACSSLDRLNSGMVDSLERFGVKDVESGTESGGVMKIIWGEKDEEEEN